MPVLPELVRQMLSSSVIHKGSLKSSLIALCCPGPLLSFLLLCVPWPLWYLLDRVPVTSAANSEPCVHEACSVPRGSRESVASTHVSLLLCVLVFCFNATQSYVRWEDVCACDTAGSGRHSVALGQVEPSAPAPDPSLSVCGYTLLDVLGFICGPPPQGQESRLQ